LIIASIQKEVETMERGLTGYRCGTEVRRSRLADSTRVTELLEMNGMRCRLAEEEAFLVAERGGEILAALAYRVEIRRLSLGVFVADPWEPERSLARMLYAEAFLFAREMGLEEFRVLSPSTDTTPTMSDTVSGTSCWHLGTDDRLEFRAALPEGGWRRVLALWGTTAVPFFRAFHPLMPGKQGKRGGSTCQETTSR
jgi:hypothetical protein